MVFWNVYCYLCVPMLYMCFISVVHCVFDQIFNLDYVCMEVRFGAQTQQ